MIYLRITVFATLSLLHPGSVGATERQFLTGHVPAITARLQPVGRLPGSSKLNFAIGLPLRNSAELSALIERIYDPASPEYRHYLVPGEFAERFGPSNEDYGGLIDFAKSRGLVVTATHPNRMLLDVSGSVEQIEAAFHVTLQIYTHPTENRAFYAPDVEPSVDLAIPLLHISGLDDFGRPRPAAHRVSQGNHTRAMALTGSGPGRSLVGNDFRAAYVPGVTLTGKGQSVALFEFDGYYASDITNYESLAGLPNVPLRNVLINGFSGDPGPGNEEVALDIQMTISMAPGLSELIVYEGEYPWDDIFNRIATDNAAKQISSSWYFYPADAILDQIFLQYAAQGQSFLQASGDVDAYPSSDMAVEGGLDPPVDHPLVTCVGGTSLTTSGPGGAWVSEVVWNLGYNLGEAASVGSSGGISPTHPIPGWQQGIDMLANHGSTVRRNIPDVALVADNIWSISDNGDASVAWGTSAAAPLWAGFTALANELAEAHGQPPVGFLNPALYALGKGRGYTAAFHDITVGNNNSSSSRTGFPAVPGYDLCSGWGTPKGSNLLYALALPQLLKITPVDNFIASGPAGGPFRPVSTSYSLSNASGSALSWAMTTDASWLDASTHGDTLTSGAPATTVILNVNAAATNLSAGSYPASAWFTNLNDGSVQERSITLAVVTTPVITEGLVSWGVPEGSAATFTVVTATNALLSYAWTRDGNALADDGRITGSTTSLLSVSNVSSADDGIYTVLVSNVAGSALSSGSLQVFPSPPGIIVPPTNQTVLPGATAIFIAGAVGSQPLSYQWQKNGTNLASGGDSNMLTLRDVSAADVGIYSVVVSNGLGSVTNTGAMLLLTPDTLPGVELTTLYSFTGGSDGANPNSLVQATDGLLYGTANTGGASNVGTIFTISTDGSLTTLHSFNDGNDGGAPKAGLVQAPDGRFYGTTYTGGGGDAWGTVFRITASGVLTTLHRFTLSGSDGYSPYAGLTLSGDGNFYGTTFDGGSHGNGAVFRMAPGGSVTTLHSFAGGDGANPRAGLTLGRDGILYGVTKGGGVNPDHGTLFRITASGVLATLFEFGGTNGFGPRGGLVHGSDGNLYGTTLNGGTSGRGTIFKMTTDGVFTTLHSFNGEDGYWPQAALIEGKDGYFYGTTSFGGTGFPGREFDGQGTVFRMSPKGQFTTLVYFDGFNGANPLAPLVQGVDGDLYGTTINGGARGYGTVFRLSIPALYLSIAISDTNVVLSWPTWASDLILQQTSDLATSNWTLVTNSPVVTNLKNQVVLSSATSGSTFYRLSH